MISAAQTHSAGGFYVPQFNASHNNICGDFITNTTSNIPGFNESVSILNIGQANPMTTCNSIPSSVSGSNPYNAASFEAYQAYLNARLGFNTPVHYPNLSTSGQYTKSISANPITTVVSNVGCHPITCLSSVNTSGSASLSSVNTSGSATTPVPSSKIPTGDRIEIENSCLSFIRSQMFRINKEEVTSSTAVNFGLQEIKDARETLFRKTGTKNYRYQGPKDPSTQHARSKFCILSIIEKIEDLSKSGIVVNFQNSAEDLYRLSRMIASQSGDASPDCFKRENLEEMARKITLLTNDVNHLKSLPHNKNSAEIPAPRYVNSNSSSFIRGIPAPNVNAPNRLNLISSIEFPGLNSPARARTQSTSASDSVKRRKTVLTGINSPATTPGSPAWKTVQKKRPRPEIDVHIPKGRPPKPTTPSYEVFLFRYSEEETPASILKYFKEVGASSAHHVRYCGGRHNGSNSFVLKFKEMKDFKVIIRNLPEYTGARPYTSEPPNMNEDRPPAYFNAGGIIRGPEIEKIFEEDDSSLMDSSEIPASSTMETVPSSSIVDTSSSVAVASTASSLVTTLSSGVVNTLSSNASSASTQQVNPASEVVLPESPNSHPNSGIELDNSPVTLVMAEDHSSTLQSASAFSQPVTSTSTSASSQPVTSAVTSASSQPVTSDISISFRGSITPLDSPHMRASNVSYESVVHSDSNI